MRGALLSILVFSASAFPSLAPPASSPPMTAITFPDPPSPSPDPKPTPDPKPAPSATTLGAENLYVVQSDAPFLLFASPSGLVSVTREAGPLRVRGKFIDGGGKVETRTLTGKHIAIIEAVGTGKVELIAVAVGSADEKEATRRTIEVDAGKGPQPPPDGEVIPAPKPKPPVVDPDPKPTPKPVPKGPYFLVTVTETSARTVAEAKLLNDVAYWQSLRTSGHDFRHFDKDDATAAKGGYTKAYAELGSCLVIVTADKPDEKGGSLVRKVPLPKTTADVTALLKELEGGGK